MPTTYYIKQQGGKASDMRPLVSDKRIYIHIFEKRESLGGGRGGGGTQETRGKLPVGRGEEEFLSTTEFVYYLHFTDLCIFAYSKI